MITMTKEELMKLGEESYIRGCVDTIKSLKEIHAKSCDDLIKAYQDKFIVAEKE